MGTFRVTIDVERSPNDVFVFVAEPRNMPRWYEAVEVVTELAPGTPTRAARYQITRSLPGGRVDNVVEVNASKPTGTVSFESREGPTPFRYRYTIEPNGEASRLTLDADISSEGLPGPLAKLDAVATRAFKRGMQDNLAELKRLLESNA